MGDIIYFVLAICFLFIIGIMPLVIQDRMLKDIKDTKKKVK